jgi:formylglycine-generating enzyme required for sulfatase activity
MVKIFERLIIIVVVIGITVYAVNATSKYIDKNVEDDLGDGCPMDMVFVPSSEGGFCIDKYEASASDDCPFASPDLQDKTVANLNDSKCKPVSLEGAYPWRYLSRNQASVACAKAGKRLATSKEWYLASLGTPDVDIAGESDCQISNNWEEQPGKTGNASNCKSGIGAYDMIGNVWEWVDGDVEDGFYEGKELPSDGFITEVDSSGMPVKVSNNPDRNYNNDYLWIKDTASRGIARGGYWNNKEKAGFYSVYIVSTPSYAGKGTGFRCVK